MFLRAFLSLCPIVLLCAWKGRSQHVPILLFQVQGETSGFLLRVSLFYEEAVISSAAPPKYQGMFGTMKTIAVEEGPR